MPLPLIAASGIWAAVIAFIGKLIPVLICWVVVGLGISLLTFAGLDFLVDQGINYVLTEYNNLPADILNLLNIAGVFDFLQIIFAGMTSVIAIRVIYQGKRIAFTGFNFGWNS